MFVTNSLPIDFSENQNNLYQVGGSLDNNSPTYVTRAADEQLYQALKQGEFCYVLNSRQVGKSSLLVKTRHRLEAEKYVCATIDLSAIGSDNIQPQQWYKGIFAELWRGFKLYKKSNFKKWWNEQEDIAVLQKLNHFIFDVLLTEFFDSQIVIFIDEIDSVLSLDFSADNFFTFIRSCFNRRATDSEYRRVTFAIFGVATPSDLIRDKTKTPFNIGKAIELTGFTFAEARPLIAGFANINLDPEKILKEILFWTGGQPFLTQKICQIVAENIEKNTYINKNCEAELVKKIVTEKIISNWENRDEPEHLKTIRNRIKSNECKAGRLLSIYQLVRLGIGVETDDSREQIELILSGLVIRKKGQLRVKNEIYRQVFNQQWIEKQLNSLRPYWQTLAAWVASQKRDRSRLLRGQALKDAQYWARDKSLSDLDYQYINASIELERKETQKILEAERKVSIEIQLNQTQENYKLQKKLLQVTSFGFLLTLLFAITAFWQYQIAEKNRKLAITSAEETRISQIEALISSSQARFDSDKKLRAIIKAIQAKQELDKLTVVPDRLEREVNLALRRVIYGENESNVLLGHKTVVYAVDISPDGESIVSSSMDRTIKIWSKEGNLIRTIEAHQDSIAEVIFSPDGKIIASASEDDTVKLWNRQGKLLNTITAHDRGVRSIAFSPDGKLLVSGGDDGTIKLWQLDGTLVKTIEAHENKIRRVVFSSDGKSIASGSRDKMVKLWRLDGTLIRTLPKHSDRVRAVAFSPDGETIVTGSMDGIVRIWKIDGTLLKTLYEHQNGIREIVFNRDGTFFASASGDGTVKIWNQDGRSIETLKGHDFIVWGVAIGPDGNTMASASEDGTVRLWKIEGISAKNSIGHCNWTELIDISPDGEIVFCHRDNHQVEIWTRSGRLITILNDEKNHINSIAYHPQNKLILTVCEDSSVKLWQLDGTLLRTFPAHDDEINHIAFSGDGKYIVSGSSDNTIKLWQLDGTLLNTFTGHGSTINFVAFSPDGQYVASGSNDRTVKLWKRDGTSVETSFGHIAGIQFITFSPDGKYIATASRDKTIKIWKIDGTYVTSLKGHRGAINAVAFSPDGKLLVSGSDDRTVKLWKRDGTILANLTKHDSRVEKVVFSRDGKNIISLSKQSRIVIWDLNPIFEGRELMYACQWAKDYLTNSKEVNEKEANLCQSLY